MKNILAFLTLFGSFGTLICCALPALLVSVGLGASLATIVSAVPQLIWISEHKIGVFVFAGFMLACFFSSRRMTKYSSCPVDPEIASACKTTKKLSGVVLLVSCLAYAVGGFFAFLLPMFL